MAELSYWERNHFFPPCDAVIVGGGIVGLSTAIHLRERRPAWRVAVLERGPIPAGASTRNAGFCCFGSISELLADLREQPHEEVLALLEKRWRGLQQLRAWAGEKAIAYEGCGGYELFTDAAKYHRCREAIPWFNEKLQELTGQAGMYRLAEEELSTCGLEQACGLIFNRGEGLLHPGRLVARLQAMARERGVFLFHGLQVEGWDRGPAGLELHTAQGLKLQAERVLLATNGLSRRLLPGLPVQGVRNQVLITRPVPGLPLRGGFHYQEGYFYFRHVGERLLLGGGRQLDPKGETTDQFGAHGGIREALLELLHQLILPGRHVEVEQWWSGILGVGPSKAPLLQEIEPGLFTAVRLGGMGVAIGALTGEEAARMLAPEAS